jgi:hypothetical protein
VVDIIQHSTVDLSEARSIAVEDGKKAIWKESYAFVPAWPEETSVASKVCTVTPIGKLEGPSYL